MSESPDDPTPPDIDLVGEWESTREDLSTKERVYEVATTLTEPADAKAVAERADCSPPSARTHLDWFVEIGILDTVGENPVLYERNENYFNYLRSLRLSREHSGDELDGRIEDAESELETLTEETDVDALIESTPIVEADSIDRVSDAYERVRRVQFLRRRLADLRRARLMQTQAALSNGGSAAGDHFLDA